MVERSLTQEKEDKVATYSVGKMFERIEKMAMKSVTCINQSDKAIENLFSWR